MDIVVGGQVFSPWLPLAVAFLVSSVTSTAGISGAFLLLPFQVSVLGFTSPAVTATNHFYNVVANPTGVLRYVRDGRLLWPLTAVILAGTAPGVVLGSLARVWLLPDPRHFKVFVGVVLLYLGWRLVASVVGPREAAQGTLAAPAQVRLLRFDHRRLEYAFGDGVYGLSAPRLVAVTALVGLVGGAYGVGGGALISPVLVSFWRLPIHSIAGATLLGTCLTSLVGVAFFVTLGGPLGLPDVMPHWGLGMALGLGGMLGTYTGARVQRHVPARLLEGVLALVVTGTGISYVLGVLG